MSGLRDPGVKIIIALLIINALLALGLWAFARLAPWIILGVMVLASAGVIALFFLLRRTFRR
jgi:hypothetical protein